MGHWTLWSGMGWKLICWSSFYGRSSGSEAEFCTSCSPGCLLQEAKFSYPTFWGFSLCILDISPWREYGKPPAFQILYNQDLQISNLYTDNSQVSIVQITPRFRCIYETVADLQNLATDSSHLVCKDHLQGHFVAPPIKRMTLFPDSSDLGQVCELAKAM